MTPNTAKNWKSERIFLLKMSRRLRNATIWDMVDESMKVAKLLEKRAEKLAEPTRDS